MPSVYFLEPEEVNSGLNVESFINCYRSQYFLGNIKTVPNITQSSPAAEDGILRILKQGITDKKDVIRIMAWKVGALDHTSCTSKSPFSYKTGWMMAEAEKNPKDIKHPQYQYAIDLNGVANFVVGNVNTLTNGVTLSDYERRIKQYNKIFNGLVQYEGIGATYALTLLYFMSQGDVPIYDKYAAKALRAIAHGLKPGAQVRYKEPEKDKTLTDNLIMGNEDCYKEQIARVFGPEYYVDPTKGSDEMSKMIDNNRKLDQALWVYGHYFPDK